MNFVGPQTPKQPLRAYAGASFGVLVRLWKNKEKEEPFSLVGYTVALVIEGVTTLTSGTGLTINEAEGSILANLTAAETANIANRRNTTPPYILSISKEGRTYFLLTGPFVFSQVSSAQGSAVNEANVAVVEPETLELVVETGTPGEPGPPGSGDLHYVFNQGAPAEVWKIKHDLGKYPSVTVQDTAGDEVMGITEYVNINELNVIFSAPFPGVAYLN